MRPKRFVDKYLLCPLAIRQLAKDGNPRRGLLAKALGASKNAVSVAEAEDLLKRIERRRAELLQRRDTVQVEDYGAGSPSDSLDGDSMRSGRLVPEIVGDACRNYSKPLDWARLLFFLVYYFKPTSCVELGSCLGLSAAYQATALKGTSKNPFIL
jgi:hypothetical protein